MSGQEHLALVAALAQDRQVHAIVADLVWATVKEFAPSASGRSDRTSNGSRPRRGAGGRVGKPDVVCLTTRAPI